MNLSHTDPARLPEAACLNAHETVEAICPVCAKLGDAVCPHCGHEYAPDSFLAETAIPLASPLEMAQRFGRLARIITSKRNARFWWACLLVATGDAAAGGVSMAQLAKKFSVTRACVSKTCVAICRLLGLPPSRYMMSEKTRTVHRQTNRRNVKL